MGKIYAVLPSPSGHAQVVEVDDELPR